MQGVSPGLDKNLVLCIGPSHLVSTMHPSMFWEYMRSSYPDTPLSEFRGVVPYVRAHGGVEALEDDEDDE